MLAPIFKNITLSAKKCGCSRSTIYRVLRGQDISLNTIVNLFFILQKPCDFQYFQIFKQVTKEMAKNGLDLGLEKIKYSGLDKEDKEFLSFYITKKKIKWQK